MRTSYRGADETDEGLASEPPGERGLIASWNRFWFTPADPTTLGLIRICCGLLVFYIHLIYTFDLEQLFGEDAWLNQQMINELRREAPIAVPPDGWQEEPPPPLPDDPEERARIEEYKQKWGGDPRMVYAQGRHWWSVWFHVSEPRAMMAVHGCILVIMFLFTIGFYTRITSALTLAAALSYIHRAPTTLFGMDTIMVILLIYLTIGASGAALSVDRLLARYRASRQGRKAQALARQPEPSVSANFALRLMQIHFCIIYFASGTSKLLGGAWWNGTALWLTLANYEFSPLDNRLYYEGLIFLTQHRLLWELIMSGGSLFTLVVEIGFPFLVWNRRLRWLMIIGAVLLHTGIAVFMGLTMFGLMMLTLLLAFVPAEAVHRLLDQTAERLATFALAWIPGSTPVPEKVEA